ncbi:MAG TPA: M15 family metallopeptidase [Victivallales bacterium]|nr:M15 family metallopeptidase [Victivallales bacterium]
MHYLLILFVLLIASCANNNHPASNTVKHSQPPPPTRFPPSPKKNNNKSPIYKAKKISNGLVTYKSLNIKGYKNRPVVIDSLFLPTLKKINTLAKKNKITVVVTSSFRKADQKLTGTVVKPARYSNHLTGHAIDMNIVYKNRWYSSASLKKSNLRNLPYNVQHFINGLRKEPDIRWGGDFNTEDPVHIDDNFNSNLVKWKVRYSLCQKQAYSDVLEM